MAYTPSMTRLIQELSKLPGIGEKTAARLAFYVLRADRSLADGMAAEEAQRREVKERAQQSASVRAAVDILGGEVTDVRPRSRGGKA